MTDDELLNSMCLSRFPDDYTSLLRLYLIEIGLQDWADEIIPGRHISYAYVAKQLVKDIVEHGHYLGADLMRLINTIEESPKGTLGHFSNIHSRQVYKDAFRAIHDIYSLPAGHADKGKQKIQIFGFKFEYMQFSRWTYPELMFHTSNRDHYVRLALSDLTHEQITAYTAKQILKFTESEIDTSLQQYAEYYSYSAFALDHHIYFSMPPYMSLAHPDDIDTWARQTKETYLRHVGKIRQNSSQNAEIVSTIDQILAKWLKPASRSIHLYHEHKRCDDDPQTHKKFEAKVRFAYLNPDLGQRGTNAASEKYIYSIETFYAGYKQVHLFYAKTLEEIPADIHSFMLTCLSRVKNRLALFLLEDPLEFSVNPICQILFRNADAVQVENVVETLRKDHQYITKAFSIGDSEKADKQFEARIRKDELQTKFKIADNASWEWNSLHTTIQLPLSVISGLVGKPLSIILGSEKDYPGIGDLIISSARLYKKGLRIDLEPAYIPLSDIVS